jgi:SAM-dependent methyltransferase
MPDDDKPRSPLDAFRVPGGATPDAADPIEDDLPNLDDPADDTVELDDELLAEEIDPAFYSNGGITLSEFEVEALGELHGRRLLVLGAGNGEDICSLINLGANVFVIDDEESLEPARDLVTGAGLQAEFVTDDPSMLSVDNRSADFDVVYSGFGAIDWVDDLDSWAGGIADSLRSGGRLVAYDEHPIGYLFGAADGSLVVNNSYFGAAAAPGAPDTADDDADNGPTWTVGDIITALGANGLATLALIEFAESDRFESAVDRLTAVADDQLALIPSTLLLTAIKL